ncbi:hypothetical protein R1sor_001826 [Riccia sorocarpa]|uniref:Uncharacterized protein n=1 Tax=Riccia sorocarpa TaxID=122646 RepID=A0ABD3GZQ6_9MARC
MRRQAASWRRVPITALVLTGSWRCIFKFMASTKQIVRKSTGGKPPDPRLSQWFKDMFKGGETLLNNDMDLGEESPTAASSEAKEVHDQDLDQDADPNANHADEDEIASEDEPGLEPSDM